MNREEKHGEFIMQLAGWKMHSYSDGGPALTYSDHAKRKAVKQARRKNRRRK